MGSIHRMTTFSASVDKVFSVVTDPKLVPDQVRSKIECEWVSGPDELSAQSEFVYEMTRMGWSQRVRLRVVEVKTNQSLVYQMISGPFSYWVHNIQVRSDAEGSVTLIEWIEYKLPFGLIGALVDDLAWKKDLNEILNARTQVLRELIES